MHVYKRSLTPVPETAVRSVVAQSPYSQNFIEFEGIEYNQLDSSFSDKEIEGSKGIMKGLNLKTFTDKNIKAT